MANISGLHEPKETYHPLPSFLEHALFIKEIVGTFPTKHDPAPSPGIVAIQVDDDPIVKKSHPSGRCF